MEIIIVENASTDNTVNHARVWSAEHGEIEVKIVRELERRGMVRALNEGLRCATGEIVVPGADCLLFKESLRNAMKYGADPNVGSVVGLHLIDAAPISSNTRPTLGKLNLIKKSEEAGMWFKLYGSSSIFSSRRTRRSTGSYLRSSSSHEADNCLHQEGR